MATTRDTMDEISSIRRHYHNGRYSEAEAKAKLKEIEDWINAKGKEIAKRHGIPQRKVYLRI